MFCFVLQNYVLLCCTIVIFHCQWSINVLSIFQYFFKLHFSAQLGSHFASSFSRKFYPTQIFYLRKCVKNSRIAHVLRGTIMRLKFILSKQIYFPNFKRFPLFQKFSESIFPSVKWEFKENYQLHCIKPFHYDSIN